MHQVVVIDTDDNYKDLLSVNLQNYLGVVVINHKSSEETLALLDILPSISLIICPFKIDDDPAAEKIAMFLKRQSLNTGLIVLGEMTGDFVTDNFTNIENKDYTAVVKAAGKNLGITAKDMMNMIVPDYIPMKATLFFELETTPCDIYIRVNKGSGEYQYIKRIHANDKFEKSDIDRYIEGGLEFFYVPKDFRLEFTNHVSKELVAKLSDDSLSQTERIAVTSASYDYSVDQLRKIGMSTNTVPVVEAVVDSMLKTVNDAGDSKAKIFDLLKDLLSDSNSYAYKHVHMTSVISSCLIKASEWGNEEQVRKLAFVSFFHDITLTSEEMLKVHSRKELIESQLSDADKKIVENHALHASEMVLEYPDLPLGAESIIKQHHGSPTGQGFVKNVTGAVSPLAATFLVAEEFACEVVKTNGELDVKPTLEAIGNRIRGAQIHKALRVLFKFFKS